MAYFADDFAGFTGDPDLSTAPGWQRLFGAAGEITITSTGKLSYNTANESLYVRDTGTVSHSIETTMNSTSNANHFLGCVRVVDVNNFFGFRYDNNQLEFFKRVSGTFTLLATAVFTLNFGDKLKLECYGNKFTLLRNNVPLTGCIDIVATEHATATLAGLHGRSQGETSRIDAVTITSALRSVSLMNFCLSGTESRAGRTEAVTYFPLTFGSGDVEAFCVSDLGWVVNTGATNDIANNFDVVEMAVQGNGVSVPIFKNGSRTWTISPGAQDSRSDFVTAQQFGLPKIIRGTQYWIKAKLRIASAGQFIPFPTGRNTGAVAGSQAWWYDPGAVTVNSVDDLGPFTSSGGHETRINGYVPFILGVFDAGDPSVFFGLGDSIHYGQGDVTNFAGGSGIFQRALYNGGVNIYAGINFCRTGVTGQVLNTATNDRVQYFGRFCNFGVEATGTNDFGTTGTTTTAATMLGRRVTSATKQKVNGIKKIIHTDLGPRTTSTNSFIDAAGQTVTGSGWATGAEVQQFNALLNTEPAIDLNLRYTAWYDIDSTKWASNGTTNYATSDGTHPSSVIHIANAAQLRGQLDNIAVDPAIVSVNSGNPLAVGDAGTAVTSGYQNNISSGTLGGKALTITSTSSTNVSFNIPDYVDNATYFNPNSTQNLILSDGVGSATVAVTTSVGDLRDVVTLNAPNIVNDRYITYWLNTPPVLGDKIIFVTADCTVDDSGAVDAPVLATKMTTMIHWILASGITQIYQVAVNNAGIVSGSVKRIFAAEKILAAGIKAVTFNTSTKKV